MNSERDDGSHEFVVLVEINFLDYYREVHFSFVGHRPLSEYSWPTYSPWGKYLQLSVT
jgi:hypothetical protein